MTPTEVCPRCGEPALPHDMHDERVCGECCGVCDIAPHPTEYLPTVLVKLSLNGIASDVELVASETTERHTAQQLDRLAARIRKAAE